MTVIGGLAVILSAVVLSGQSCSDRPRTTVELEGYYSPHGMAYALAIAVALFVGGLILLFIGIMLVARSRPVPTPAPREPTTVPAQEKADVYWPRETEEQAQERGGSRTPGTR